MLVLSRKKEEKIHIGNDITITVLRIKGHSVQIGIEAPDGVAIFRNELLPASEEAGRQAPRLSIPPLKSPHHGVGLASLREKLASLRHVEDPLTVARLESAS
jgi:carbon storage regulator